MAVDRIVLVHGTMDRATSFAKVVRALGEFECVAYDRRGYGRSGRPAPPSVDAHVDDLLEVLAERPAVVGGHSLGGDVALAAAGRRPDLVQAVAAWEAPLPWLPWWPANSAGVRATSTGLAAADAAEVFMRGVVGDEVWDGLPEATKESRRAEGDAMLVDVGAARAGPLFDAAQVAVPVVAGCGGASKPYHRAAAEWLAAHVEGAELYQIPGATHGAHKSHPDEFARFIRRAVERTSS